MDREVKLSKGFKVPDFSKFSRKYGKLKQRPEKIVEQFTIRFKRTRVKCLTALDPQSGYVKLTHDSLGFEQRKF